MSLRTSKRLSERSSLPAFLLKLSTQIAPVAGLSLLAGNFQLAQRIFVFKTARVELG